MEICCIWKDYMISLVSNYLYLSEKGKVCVCVCVYVWERGRAHGMDGRTMNDLLCGTLIKVHSMWQVDWIVLWLYGKIILMWQEPFMYSKRASENN